MFSTGINAVCAENNFYTLDKMKDPYCWERIYAAGMDSKVGSLNKKIIFEANPLVRNGETIINYEEKVQLAAIMAMQLLRGKHFREYGKKIYQDTLPEVRKKIEETLGSLSRKQYELLQAFENDEYYFKRTSMDIALDSKRITRYTEILCDFDFLFYRIYGNVEYITSDNPVMIIDSITSDAIPFTNGLLKISRPHSTTPANQAAQSVDKAKRESS